MGSVKSVMNVDEITKIKRNITMYIKDENINNNEVINKMNDISYYYRSNNSNRINSLASEINKNFARINRVHNINTKVYEKMIERYKKVSGENAEKFDGLGGVK